MQTSEHYVGFRKAGNSPRFGIVAIIIAAIVTIVAVISNDSKVLVRDTYTRRTYEVTESKIVETEFVSERKYRTTPEQMNAGISLAIEEVAEEAYVEAEKAAITEEVIEIEESAAKPIATEAKVQEVSIKKHYP